MFLLHWSFFCNDICLNSIRQTFNLSLCINTIRACLPWRLESYMIAWLLRKICVERFFFNLFFLLYIFFGIHRYSHIDCSGHGVCIDGVCTCDATWTGEACEIQVCPNNCSHSHGQGECNRESHHCDCVHGFKGEIFY